MDATVQKQPKKPFVPWRPEVRAYGDVEIGVEHWSDELGRYVFDSVRPQEYVSFWDKGWLKFQGTFNGKPLDKPESYPTPEQVEEYLEWRAKENGKKLQEHERMLRAPAKPAPRPRLVEPPVVEEANPAAEKDKDLAAHARALVAVRASKSPAKPLPKEPKQAEAVPTSPVLQAQREVAASKPTPQPGALPVPPAAVKLAGRVDPMVLAEYKKAAKEIRLQDKEPTVELLADRLVLKPFQVASFLRLHPDFERYPEPEVEISAIAVSPRREKGRAFVERQNAKDRQQVSSQEKKEAFAKASEELWLKQKPTPLRVVTMVRRAHELLGVYRIAEASLNCQFYVIFSESERALLLNPGLAESRK